MAREKIFETRVKRYIEGQGGWHVKFFANKYTKVGVPDILSCINGYFVAVEVKADRGTPSELQLHTIKQIRDAGGFAFVLYPSGYEFFKEFVDDLKKDIFNTDIPLIVK